MLFNSPVFLFAFLPVVYLVYWRLSGRNSRYGWLVLTGYVFYGYWKPSFCLVMAFSTLVSFLAGLGIQNARTRTSRRLYLTIPIVIDLALLAFFKYADFALRTVNTIFAREDPLPSLNILLPVGISFYTFHTISYIVDCYRGTIQPTRNLLEFACYVSLFSQLVAGPIIRFSELREDLDRIAERDRGEMLERGWSFFALGMIQKVLLADTLAEAIDPALSKVGSLSSVSTWLCAFGYSYQLLLDFAGYSNMAIGLGALFGMHIPQNFNRPYQALNPSDFWRRWHISLSRCLRDYIYLPLGGNRGARWFVNRNLLITMLLGGLWHGANWTFVLWGLYHGVLLIAHRHTAGAWERLPAALQRGFTFLLIVLGWVLFRSTSTESAFMMLSRMFIPTAGDALGLTSIGSCAFIIAAVLTHAGPSSFELTHRWRSVVAFAIAALFLLSVLRTIGASSSPFLYFQF